MIILAHVSPPNLLFQIRNFDVPFMVFLSGALAGDSLERRKTRTGIGAAGHIKKRFLRLIVPTWCFLSFYFVALKLLQIEFSQSVIIKSYLLQHDSIGYVWVIWIYLMCGAMAPYFYRIPLKEPISVLGILGVYAVYELCFAKHLGTGNRFISTTIYYAVPYGCITILGMNYSRFKRQEKQCILAAASLVYLCLLLYLWDKNGGYLTTQAYKYPPRLYYMSYGIMMSMLVSYILERKPYAVCHSKAVRFISTCSLWIYLWHIFYLRIVPRFVGNSWYIVYVCVIACSMFTVYLQNLIVDYVEERGAWAGLSRIFKG